MNDANIKIYISMHKLSYIPNNRYIFPIQVGCALSDKKFENMLYDDTGDNISDKNLRYCELTAQYWAWKNDDADYYGFFHYRRYFSFNPLTLPNTREHITYYDSVNDEVLKELYIDEDIMPATIKQYDLIIPNEAPVGNNKTVVQHWNDNLNPSDLELMIQIILKKYPEYRETVNFVLNSYNAIYCNMFIMSKELFNAYNEWLFDILFEHESLNDHSEYNTEKYRTMGHLAERLCAIYCKHIELNNKNLKILKLDRTLFKNTKPVEITQPITNNYNLTVPIVLACDNNYIKYTSVLISSIIKNSNNNTFYDITILHQNINESNQVIIENMCKNIDNFSIRFNDVTSIFSNYKNLFVDRHLSIETYYRFALQDIMLDYNKALYLDCDTIVKQDVAILFNINIENYLLGAVKDCDLIGTYYFNKNGQFLDDKNHVEYFNNTLNLDIATYFQAGVILFNLKELRNCLPSVKMFKKAIEGHWWFHDQDCLNMLCNGKVKYIPAQWNVMYEAYDRARKVQFAPTEISTAYFEAKKNPYIIHYAGTPKPWHDFYCEYSLDFWENAKVSPYYELLLHEYNYKKLYDLTAGQIWKLQNLNYAPPQIQTQIQIVERYTNEIQVEGVKEIMTADGIMIKLVNKLNKMYPMGSKRRAFVKKLFGWMVK